jgi:1-acyl-sn-glycerol-3-phosphate acyltransferase
MTGHMKAISRLIRLGLAILAARREGRTLDGVVERAAWQQRQATRMLAALDVDVRVMGLLPREGMVVCNHLSYLDILVIAAQGSVVFVAKSDVRKWPAIGGLLECAGTILAERGRPLSSGTTSEQIRRVLEAGVPVVLFPEGTSSDGSDVLPFKPTLLQAALDTGVQVTPAAIFYQADGGDAAQDVCYWGDATFFPHLVRLARLRRVTADLTFGRAVDLLDDRKVAARTLHAAVAALAEHAAI